MGKMGKREWRKVKGEKGIGGKGEFNKTNNFTAWCMSTKDVSSKKEPSAVVSSYAFGGFGESGEGEKDEDVFTNPKSPSPSSPSPSSRSPLSPKPGVYGDGGDISFPFVQCGSTSPPPINFVVCIIIVLIGLLIFTLGE